MADTPEMLTARLNDLTRRVGVLERPAVVPPIVPPTTKVESPDLTTLPPAAFIVDSALRTLMVVGGKVVVDGATIAATSGVVLLKKVDHPVNPATARGVYQKNSAGGWYGPITATSGGAQVPGDPSLATPIPPTVPPVVLPSTGSAPAAASSVGYTRRTLGPDLTLGRNWFPCDFYGNPNDQHVTQVSSGVLRFAGGANGFNAHACTTKQDGTGPTFGNGAYFEATLGWEGNYNKNDGWPSWWANQIGMMRGDGEGIELDFMEWWSNTNFGTAVHHWWLSGAGHIADGSSNDMPASFDHAAQHRYGCLWVPATDQTQGYIKMFLDGNLLKTTLYSKGVGDWAVTDTDSFALILGSNSGNPMTVTKVEVWQRP